MVGGIFGIISGIMAMAVGGLGAAFNSSDASGVVSLGVSAIILSTIGIIGAAMVSSKAKIGGLLMVITTVGGTISVSIFYVLPGILLIIGGLMALIRKDRNISKVEGTKL